MIEGKVGKTAFPFFYAFFKRIRFNCIMIKKQLLLLLFYSLCLSANAQLSVFSEFGASPPAFKDEILVKNLSLGLQYDLTENIFLRAGVNAFDSRKGVSKSAYIDVLIIGLFPQMDNCATVHNFDLNSNSVFLGAGVDVGKFRFLLDAHRVHGKLENGSIVIDESYLFVTNPDVRTFDSSYKDVSFNRLQLGIAYEVLKKEKGSFYLISKISKDFQQSTDALLVESYDDELMPYVSSIPGGNFNTIAEFLEKSDLNYAKERLFLGVQLNYSLF